MKLEVAVEDVSQCVKDLTIEVPAEQVKLEFDKVYENYQRNLKLPGFRPGRVPRELLRQRFGKETKEYVVKQLLAHALEHAIKDKQLRIIGEPTILDYSVNEGEPTKFKSRVEVLPEFELKEYKGLKATKRVLLVSDDDVENTLQSWRESAIRLLDVEGRPSEIGDVVSVNLVGKFIEPKEEEDLKAEDVHTELGAPGTHPAFTENLIGVKAGDVREFRVVYPTDFTSRGLAGKTVDFVATVTAVRRKELPELDDDFAKQSGEVETMAQLRDRVRESLAQNQEHRAEINLRGDLLEQLLQEYDFDLPPSVVEQQAVGRAREFASLLMQNGMSEESVAQWNWEEHLVKERQRAARDIRAMLIASKISEVEGLRVAQTEVDAEIARLADSTGEPFAQLKARLTKEEALSSIENRLLYEKAMKFIVDNAEVSVREISAGHETEDAKAEAAGET